MNKKIEIAITDTENRIQWEQELIDRLTEDIREYTKTCTPENMAMFLPGKIMELDEAINRRKKYTEQLNMLQFVQKDN